MAENTNDAALHTSFTKAYQDRQAQSKAEQENSVNSALKGLLLAADIPVPEDVTRDGSTAREANIAGMLFFVVKRSKPAKSALSGGYDLYVCTPILETRPGLRQRWNNEGYGPITSRADVGQVLANEWTGATMPRQGTKKEKVLGPLETAQQLLADGDTADATAAALVSIAQSLESLSDKGITAHTREL